MDAKEKLKLKIKALLAKTTANGATEQEALAAMKKAKSLMDAHLITMSEVSDPLLGEKCVLRSTPLIKSGYMLNGFYNELSMLFDCEYYYTQSDIFFYGFEEDVELCIYFYEFIIKSVLVHKERFKNTKRYRELKDMYHGRSLVSSFIKGYLTKVAVKMEILYHDRKTELDKSKYGLVLYDKKKKVDDSFKALDLSISKKSIKNGFVEEMAFGEGVRKGNEFELVQGVGATTLNRVARIGC